jgi:hypothetical protein
MKVEYSLLLLREELEELKEEKTRLKVVDPVKSARKITQLIHQIADLEFAIEVLETYLD